MGVAFLPDGSALVSEGESHRIVSVDARQSAGLAWGPDGRLYEAEFRQNTLDEINRGYRRGIASGLAFADRIIRVPHHWYARVGHSGIGRCARHLRVPRKSG